MFSGFYQITEFQNTLCFYQFTIVLQSQKGVVLKNFSLIIWLIFLLLFTCASNSGFWFRNEMPNFHLLLNPDFKDLFKLDFKSTSGYIFQKIGHFIGFSILSLLHFWRNSKNVRNSIIFSVVFAMLTEILQLFFGRDGRLYDILIDSIGILSGILLLKSINMLKIIKKRTHQSISK